MRRPYPSLIPHPPHTHPICARALTCTHTHTRTRTHAHTHGRAQARTRTGCTPLVCTGFHYTAQMPRHMHSHTCTLTHTYTHVLPLTTRTHLSAHLTTLPTSLTLSSRALSVLAPSPPPLPEGGAPVVAAADVDAVEGGDCVAAEEGGGGRAERMSRSGWSDVAEGATLSCL